MKRITTLVLCLTFVGLGILQSQNPTQATLLRTGGLQITIYAKPTNAVAVGSNVFASFSVSVPASGPVPTLTHASSIGGTLTAATMETIGGRYNFPYQLEQPNLATAFTAGANNALAVITFPSQESGELVQLNDMTGSGTLNVYWYISYTGIDATNYAQKYYGTNATNSEFGDSFVEANLPLPVTLISFKAEKFNDRNSLLSWATASEINSSHFTVQRSLDKKSWSNIGRVNAHGNSQIIQNYEFVDQNVYNGKDASLTVYYRLQAVDLDNQTKNSPIESVVFGTGTASGREISVYPNPSSEGLQVEWDANRVDQPTVLEFFDVHGKLVYSSEVSDNTNQQYIDYGFTTIQPGLYILRILSGTETIDHKQIVVTQR